MGTSNQHDGKIRLNNLTATKAMRADCSVEDTADAFPVARQSVVTMVNPVISLGSDYSDGLWRQKFRAWVGVR